jgi:hypothetical protein
MPSASSHVGEVRMVFVDGTEVQSCVYVALGRVTFQPAIVLVLAAR